MAYRVSKWRKSQHEQPYKRVSRLVIQWCKHTSNSIFNNHTSYNSIHLNHQLEPFQNDFSTMWEHVPLGLTNMSCMQPDQKAPRDTVPRESTARHKKKLFCSEDFEKHHPHDHTNTESLYSPVSSARLLLFLPADLAFNSLIILWNVSTPEISKYQLSHRGKQLLNNIKQS